MRSYTNTATVVHHEDGSWTETTEITHQPATKAEKATAVAVLGAMVVLPAVPILFVASLEKASAMKEKYRAKRLAKKSEK